VVKYGGNAMTSPELAKLFCEDAAFLRSAGVPLVVVHGGGPMITRLLGELAIPSSFDPETGVRVSDEPTVRAASYALGAVNKNLASAISAAPSPCAAVGLDGRDARLLRCRRQDERLGNVGVVEVVNAGFLKGLVDAKLLPVISPIGAALEDGDETIFNVNADAAAGAVAVAVGSPGTIFLTDISGVLDASKKLLPTLTPAQVDALIEDGTIAGGMIPKVRMAVEAAAGGGKAVIADGRKEHALVREVYKLLGAEMDVGGGGEGGTTIG
jgi:acetylglutamate kinase